MSRRHIAVGALALALALGSIDAGHAAESLDVAEKSTTTDPGSANAVVSAAADITGSRFSLASSLAQEALAMDADFALAAGDVTVMKRFALAAGDYTGKITLSDLDGMAASEGKAGSSADIWPLLDCGACRVISAGHLDIVQSSHPLNGKIENGTITAVIRFTVPEATTVAIGGDISATSGAFTGFSTSLDPDTGIYLHGGGSAAARLTGVVESIVVEPIAPAL